MAVHRAAHDNDTQALIRLLVSGSDPGLIDEFGAAPLHSAADASSLEALLLLISAGARPDVADNNGNTPLIIAVTSCDATGLVTALLSAGADPHRVNYFRHTASDMARLLGHEEQQLLFANIPTRQALAFLGSTAVSAPLRGDDLSEPPSCCLCARPDPLEL